MRTAALLLLPALLVACPPKQQDTETGDDTGEANAAPALTVDSPVEGASYEEGTVVTVAGFVVDDRGLFSLTLTTDDDVTMLVPEADGTFTKDLTLAAGDHTLTIEATDTDQAVTTVTRHVTITAGNVDDPPTAPVIHIDPADPVTGDGLAVAIDTPSEDPEGANVTYTYAWTADGVAAGTSLTVDGTTRGQVWEVTVVASDGALTSEATATVTIGNAPPLAAGVTLSPEGATASDAITCAVQSARDVEGDPLTEAYAFTVDGEAAGDGTPILAAGSAAAGQSVACVVTLDDGTDSVSFSSAPLIVAGTAPSAPEIAISPTEPADTDDLACAVVVDATDPDGDALTYSYAWSRDGVATGYTDASIPADETHRDEVWTCEVVASDGVLTGPVASASVTIGVAWSGLDDTSGAWGTIDGAVTSGAFGKAIALVGDMDGDGLSELAVSANGEASAAGVSAGAVYLFAGADLGGAITTADATASWDGEYAEGQLGGFRAVAAPGDLDDDGVADLLFAAPDADAYGDGSGIAYLFYGGGDWGLDADPGEADARIVGTANDQVGPRMIAMDVDGDGWDELVVAAPGSSDSGRESGTVAFFAGTGSRWSGQVTFADADERIYGDAEGDELGWTLKNVGDVDGDGYEDLFTAAIYSDPAGTDAGTGGLVLGGALSGSDVLANVATALFTGDTAGDRMGYDAVGRVDVDEDGVSDLLVAEYQDDTSATDAGAVYVFLGRGRWAASYTGVDADHTVLGDGASGRFGHVMASPGDLDGDGKDDLVIGALFASPTGLTYQGAAYVVSSPDWASASTATELAWTSAGEAASDMYGDALGVGRGDLDGDGRNDFVVGAQGHDAGGTSAGRVYLWRGR